MTIFQRKILSWFCVAMFAFCFMFIVIAIPCLCCKINGKIIIKEDTAIALSVLVPFLVGIISILVFRIVKVFTKDDALRQIEQQFRNGVIDVKTYKNTYKDIEMFEMEKKQLKYQIEMEKKLMKEEIKNKVYEIRKETENNN